MLKTLKEVLMERDQLSEAEADSAIAEAKKELNDRLNAGELPFDICEELFGLEPDYLTDLIDFF
jgi:hypothetical protein